LSGYWNLIGQIDLSMHHFVVFLPNYKRRRRPRKGQWKWRSTKLGDDPSLSFHNPFRKSPFLSIKLQLQSFAQEMGCSCTNLGFNGSFFEMSSFFLGNWTMQRHAQFWLASNNRKVRQKWGHLVINQAKPGQFPKFVKSN